MRDELLVPVARARYGGPDDDGAELPRRGRDAVEGAPEDGGEYLGGHDKDQGVGPDVEHELGEREERHADLVVGRRVCPDGAGARGDEEEREAQGGSY